VFPNGATIRDVRIKVAEKLKIDPGAVILLLAGNTLQDRFIIDRLRIDEQEIIIDIDNDS
jgi:hypothetical protein